MFLLQYQSAWTTIGTVHYYIFSVPVGMGLSPCVTVLISKYLCIYHIYTRETAPTYLYIISKNTDSQEFTGIHRFILYESLCVGTSWLSFDGSLSQ